jgi:hypothetical protein
MSKSSGKVVATFANNERQIVELNDIRESEVLMYQLELESGNEINCGRITLDTFNDVVYSARACDLTVWSDRRLCDALTAADFLGFSKTRAVLKSALIARINKLSAPEDLIDFLGV